MVVGRVGSIWLNPLDPEPLLYHDGAYTRLQDGSAQRPGLVALLDLAELLEDPP